MSVINISGVAVLDQIQRLRSPRALVIGSLDRLFLLGVGESITFHSVPHQLIELSGDDGIKVADTGLRPGPNVHEVLFQAGDPDERPCDPVTPHAGVPAYVALSVRSLDPQAISRRSAKGFGIVVPSWLARWSTRERAFFFGWPQRLIKAW